MDSKTTAMDGTGTDARFNYPWGIEFDSEDNVLYVADCVSVQGIVDYCAVCATKRLSSVVSFCVLFAIVYIQVSIYTGIYPMFNIKHLQFCSWRECLICFTEFCRRE